MWIELIERILISLRLKIHSAIRFFECLERLTGSRHSLQSFCALLHALLSQKMYASTNRVFVQMIGYYLVNSPEIFVTVFEGLRKYTPHPYLGSTCSFLLEGYCRNRMANQCMGTLHYMCKSRIWVSSSSLSRVLNFLGDSSHVNLVANICKILYNSFGSEYHKNIYESVMVSFLKKVEIKKFILML